jgi:hypothetical protein
MLKKIQIFKTYIGVYVVCGLVIRVPGYTSRDPGFDYQRYQIF